MKIGDKEITLDEFERIYKKNNNNITSTRQTPEEYLDLFIKFKLKVIEAESLGMDTAQKFLKEFNGYQEQLAKPYLTDDETEQAMMKEAYERMKYDVHVNHILLKLDRAATPEATLIKYNQALKIRKRLLNGEDFASVARATSEDNTVQMNGGDLGFFTAFTWPYPFETAAYNLKVGEISMPVRTIYGYNIVKKVEQRPASGQIKVAQIFLRAPEGIPAEEKSRIEALAMAIYDSLNLGVDFRLITARYSDDRGTAARGGELPWFGAGRMIREFENVAFSIQDTGTFCKPFQSFYGWHIIKLLDRKRIGTFEEMESEINAKVTQGDWGQELQKKKLERLKKINNYTLNNELYNKLVNSIDSSIFSGEWNPAVNADLYNKFLFTTDLRGATVKEFSEYLAQTQSKKPAMLIENYVETRFKQFLEKFLKDNELMSLPEKYPEYKYILQEYHDGILLFDLMDQMVWSKAVKDTLGLEKFFQEHRSDYMWGERMEAVIVACDSSVDISSVAAKSSRIASGKWDQAKLNKKFCSDSVDCISLEKIVVEKGRNAHVDELNGKIGTGKVYSDKGKLCFVINKAIVPPAEKMLNETRGQATSDYQDYLEVQWINELKAKYKVTVNTDLLAKIKN